MKNIKRGKIFILCGLALIAGLLATSRLFADWYLEDIGPVGIEGAATFNETLDIHDISGAGTGGAGTSDALSFIYSDIAGDFELTAKVTNLVGDDPYAQAGLMVREGLGASAKNSFLFLSNEDGINFTYRTAASGGTWKQLRPPESGPVWLRLRKIGSGVYGYKSDEGAVWSLVGGNELSLTKNFQVGLAIASGVSGTLANAQVQKMFLLGNPPDAIPSLKLWLRADAGVTKDVNGKVSEWKDQSGYANHALQATAGYQPTWVENGIGGRASLRFSSSNGTFLSIPASASISPERFTIYGVAKNTSPGSAIVAQKFGAVGNQYALWYRLGAGAPTLTSGTANIIASAASGTSLIFESLYDGSALTLALNGVAAGAVAYSDILGTSTNPLWVGGQGSSVGLNGDIAEILLFDRVLNAEERRAMAAYFHQKYGIGLQPQAANLAEDKISPSGGIYSGAKNVTVEIPDGAVVRYTTNGSDPDETSAVYSGPISVTSSTTLKFRSYRTGFSPSGVTTATYTIDGETEFTRNGLAAWLRADTGLTLSGSNVTLWKDQSGKRNHAVGYAGYYPVWQNTQLNGKPAVRFNAAGGNFVRIENKDEFNANRISVIAVVKQLTPASNAVVLKKGSVSSNQYALYYATQTTPGFISGAANPTGTIAAGVFGVLSGVYDGTDMRLYVNGTLAQAVSATSALTPETQPIYIGGYGSGNGLTGDIAELLIFDRALSQFEQGEVELYLHTRYGVGAVPTTEAVKEETLSLAGGIYRDAQLVTVPVPSGVTVRYTTNGSDPDETSPSYSGPITVNSTTTLKFRAYRTNFLPSAVTAVTYTIESGTEFTRNGLVAWLRADTGLTLSGSNVTLWKDQSGKRNHAVGHAGYQPTWQTNQLNSQPTVRFSATGGNFVRIENKEELNPSQISIVTVVKQSAVTSTSVILKKGSSSTNQYTLYYASQTNPRFISGAANPSGTLSAGAFGVLSGVYDGAEMRLYVNGSLAQAVPATSALAAEAQPIYIGGYGSSGGLTGDIAELFVFNRALSSVELGELELYLHTRYAVGTVPTTEPIKEDTLSVGGGIYSGEQVVTVPVPSGATVRYTTDGNDPDGSSAIYSGPITVTSTTTLKFRVYRTGFLPSAVTTATYTIEEASKIPRSGLVVWLRGDTGVGFSGSNVIAWKDQSGHSNHATGVTGYFPTWQASQLNGKSAVSFNRAGGQFLRVENKPMLNPGLVTVIAVAKQTVDSASSILLQKLDSGGNQFALYYPSGSLPTMISRGATASGSLTMGTFGILGGVYDGSSLKLSINGSVVSTTAYSGGLGNGTGPICIGGQGASYGMTGAIAELLIYDRVLSPVEKGEVELYLHSRYALGAVPTTEAVKEESLSAAGGIYTQGQVVTVPVPSGVTVRYTTNGSDPDETSSIYSGPITVNSTTTLKFRAYRTGFLPSAVTTATYTIEETTIIPRSGLLLWLRGDTGLGFSGSSVNLWRDQSGKANHATGVTGYLPTWQAGQLHGKAVVRFNRAGSQYLRVESKPALNPGLVTIIAVAKQTVDSATSILVQKVDSGGNQYALYYPSGAVPRMISRGASASGSLTMGTFGILGGIYDGASLKLSVNGSVVSTAAYSGGLGNSSEPIFVGGNPSGHGMTGDIAEVFIFDHVLTAAESNELQAYLYQRYALGSAPALAAPGITKERIFAEEQEIEITTPEAGATVFYTTDGSDPDESDLEYTGSFVVAGTTVVKARAYKAGYSASGIVEAKYTRDDAVAEFSRSGLALWLRADTGVVNSSGVSQWKDQSGAGGVAAQATSTNRPVVVSGTLNGQTVVRFDGANDFLSLPDSTLLKPEKMTIYVVGKRGGGGNNGTILFKSSGTALTDGYGLLRQGSGDNFGFYVNNNSSTKATGNLGAGSEFQIQAAYNRNHVSLFINGRPQPSLPYTTVISHSTQALNLGGSGLAANSFGGDIAEVLFFDRPLTVEEQAKVEKYLGARYGIDTDADGDGLPRWRELELGTDPGNADTNGNGLKDGAEYNSGFNPSSLDSDGDGLTNAQEYALGTNAFWADSDGDGVNDASDAYPLDPAASSNTDPTPTAAPTITLDLPTNATLLP